jgi:hypothetical protein
MGRHPKPFTIADTCHRCNHRDPEAVGGLRLVRSVNLLHSGGSKDY